MKRVDGKEERAVLTGMVFNRQVLATVVPHWKPDRLPSRAGCLIGGWCVNYYRKYQNAPCRDVVRLYDAWAETNSDRDVTEMVETLLRSIGESDPDEIRPEYTIDLASRVFERVRLKEMTARVEALLEQGDVDGAKEYVEQSRRIEIGRGAGVCELTDDAGMIAAFEKRSESLIEYGGALKDFFSSAFCRGGFIGIMAGEKKGKSALLLDMAWTAVEQKRNVAYFGIADMADWQVRLRLAARRCKRPIRAGRWYVPTEIEAGTGQTVPLVQHDMKSSDEDLSFEEDEYQRRKWASRVGTDRLRFACYPAIGVSGIEAVLDRYAEEYDWTPDVTIIDYADVLDSPDSKMTPRDATNANWKAMRQISLKRNCLTITATQADADSYDTWVLKRNNFSEDKRKYSHVTGMLGWNQTAGEKELGAGRLNWLMLRDLEYNEERCVWCAGCWATASPLMLSTY